MKLSSRKQLLFESELVIQKIRKKIKEDLKLKDFDFDKDVSTYDWEEMRKKDPTLPEKDPRYWYREGFFGEKKIPRKWEMSELLKWVYFSDDFGSYLKRSQMADDPKMNIELRKKLFPHTIDNLPPSYLGLIGNKKDFKSLLLLIGKILAGF